mmetsp:Transcript_20772/g.48566  ORF Transcript_20772/g.48566 Transcript_20772/m.48566 type:complete len:208 (+) Transcript_20772:67-690(+)
MALANSLIDWLEGVSPELLDFLHVFRRRDILDFQSLRHLDAVRATKLQVELERAGVTLWTLRALNAALKELNASASRHRSEAPSGRCIIVWSEEVPRDDRVRPKSPPVVIPGSFVEARRPLDLEPEPSPIRGMSLARGRSLEFQAGRGVAQNFRPPPNVAKPRRRPQSVVSPAPWAKEIAPQAPWQGFGKNLAPANGFRRTCYCGFR